MSFEIKDFIDAIAAKLALLYPNHKVYDDKIGRFGYKNCFYISVVSSGQKMLLGGRCERTYGFDILFFQENDSKESFFDWTEKMYPEFIWLQAEDSLYMTRDLEIKTVDGVGHCSFSVGFCLKPVRDKDFFAKLKWEGSVKHE